MRNHRSARKTQARGIARAEPRGGNKIRRFASSEIQLHWAIALPFLVCYSTALVLVFVYNPAPDLPLRILVSWIHRISGVGMVVLPGLVVFRNRRCWKLHLHNVRQAWVWTLDDLKWLTRSAGAALGRNAPLPEVGKFNAGEKLNFMVVMTTYPLFILTGVLIWLPGVAFFGWLAHVFMAAVATPLVLGHIFMATINPGTRKGLTGMVTGFVDRTWAKHHYPRWFHETFGGKSIRAGDVRASSSSRRRAPARRLQKTISERGARITPHKPTAVRVTRSPTAGGPRRDERVARERNARAVESNPAG